MKLIVNISLGNKILISVNIW